MENPWETELKCKIFIPTTSLLLLLWIYLNMKGMRFIFLICWISSDLITGYLLVCVWERESIMFYKWLGKIYNNRIKNAQGKLAASNSGRCVYQKNHTAVLASLNHKQKYPLPEINVTTIMLLSFSWHEELAFPARPRSDQQKAGQETHLTCISVGKRSTCVIIRFPARYGCYPPTSAVQMHLQR